jgi:hypothetical protein
MSEAEKIAEEALILRLLAGFAEDDRGQPITSYLKHNSREEKRARALLAAQIREGKLAGFAKELLALAIDPATPSTHLGMKPTRTVQFISPSRGKASTWAHDLLVADFIKRKLHECPKKEAALAAAADRFNIKRSRLQQIWKAHEKSFATR